MRMRSPGGSYSMVLLRRVLAGKVETQLVEGEFYPKATGYNAPNAYKVIATLDLDGDGKMEVVVGSSYHEGEESQFTVAVRKRSRLYFLSLGAPDRHENVLPTVFIF